MQDDSPAAAQFGEEQASPEPQTHNKSSDSPEAVDITMKTFQRKQNSPLPLTLEQEEALNELLEKREKSKARSNYEMLDSGDPKKPNARFVSEDNYLEGLVFEPTQSLADNVEGKPFSLQPHQKHGVAWLQYSFKTALADISRAKRQGGLLADDMGLGKTVQVLCFLAWCIESGLLRRSDEKADRPILVIAPLILLSVWQREIVKYFYAQGRILHPLVLLHGDGLKKYLNADKTLNVESLSKNRLVITNYDTVKTYIHSLKEIGWSLVVLDEAQEVKDPRTNIFRCVKLLKSLFCVAVTGTPVENGLLDLWSIMDIAQPGLLGESKEFLKRYAPNDETDDLKEKAEQLRRQLRCNTPETYILRRTKEGSLTGLPQKKQILRLIPLGQEQTQLHLELARGLAGDGTQGGHLKALQSIAKIYQHPALLYEQAITKSREEYFESCAKLQDLANLLLEIKRKKEKVLIFTRYVNMQLILQYVFENNFGHFEIINGSNNSSAQPPMRQRIIDEFEKKNGFNALILSPQVAGVGLTITGANNVVHYGRWWNPAQEAQATDRVYRLGQTKQVNVYQMISISEQFRTFDERVHMLLSQKAKIATDFLIPTSKMSITEKELLDCLISDVENQPEGEAVVFSLHDVRNLSPNQLESLVAAVWRRLKFETFLLPSQMSGAVKVLAVSRREIQMIGVNTREDCRIDDLFRDVAESSNYLQSKLSSGAIADLAFKSVLVLNYNVSQNVVESARGGLTVIRESDLKGMVSEYKTKVQDVLREESLRLSSFEELLAKLNRG
jgi:SNF2 family DNA or RNA helicase